MMNMTIWLFIWWLCLSWWWWLSSWRWLWWWWWWLFNDAQVKDVRVPEQLMRAMAAEAEAARNARAKVTAKIIIRIFVITIIIIIIIIILDQRHLYDYDDNHDISVRLKMTPPVDVTIILSITNKDIAVKITRPLPGDSSWRRAQGKSIFETRCRSYCRLTSSSSGWSISKQLFEIFTKNLTCLILRCAIFKRWTASRQKTTAPSYSRWQSY